ncbi:MAG: YciI family protein [Methyloceanibacter sp.]
MRFISMVKFAEASAVPPPKAFLDAMDQLMKDAATGGCVMVEAGGLLPTAAGARVRLAGGKVAVMDGPFTETKEVVGGYAIFEVNSKAEMLHWTERFVDLHRKDIPGWEGEAEVRQLAGPGEKLCDQVREAHAATV